MASTSSTVRLIFQGSQQGVVSAAAQSIAALKALGDENTKVGKAFGKADEQATKFIKTATKAAAVTSLVTAVGGGLGQAFAGALPILASLGIAAGTVALGMDGIKKAAEVTKKPFEDLKKAVSGTFARDMAAPFKDVAGLLPKLTSGFQSVATSISGAFGSITKFAASARGVAVLQDVLVGAASFIDGFGPQLTKFLDGFLSAIASAKGEMRGLGDAFGSIFGKIGGVLRTLANDDAGTFSKAIAGLSATLRGLGTVIGTVVDVAIRLGAAFGDSFEVLFNGLADGLQAAAPGLLDLGSALGDLLRAISPLLPTIGELAGSFAHDLANGIRAVIPYVQDFAAWASNNVGTIKDIAIGIAALAVGVKALSIFTSVVGWVSAATEALKVFKATTIGVAIAGWVADAAVGFQLLTTRIAASGVAAGISSTFMAAFGRTTATAAVSAGAASVAGGRLVGVLRRIAPALAVEAVLLGLSHIGDAAGAASGKVTGLRDEVALFATKASHLDLGFFMRDFIDEVKFGSVIWAEFKNSISGFKLTPLKLNVDAAGAKAQTDKLISEINGAAPMININGNTNGAAFAYQEIKREIAEGKTEVLIDGNPVPAQEALRRAKLLIDTSIGTVSIDGRDVKASDALDMFIAKANKAEATTNLNSNPAKAVETVNGWTRFAEGTTGQANLSANPAGANATLAGWKGAAGATTGTATLSADPRTANSTTATWKGTAERTTGTAQLNANPSQANQQTSGWKVRADGSIGTASLHADPGPANATLSGLLARWGHQVLNWTVRILSSNPDFVGQAAGGPIVGPGTGTSDTAGLFRLSNGEHVLTAREVQLMGGQNAVLAFRQSLTSGKVPRMTATSGRAAAGGAVTPAGALSIPTPQVSVAVHIGNQEITDIVRTEVSHSNRQTRRTVLSGAGATF
jgi:hypothetical protein